MSAHSINDLDVAQVVAFDQAQIPSALKAIPNWVCWKAVLRNERIEKIPVSPVTGRHASTTDPTTWTDFNTAARAAQAAGHGIGFVFTAEQEIVGIDLDKCRDPDTGTLESWAQEIVAAINSYTEVSPSGTGLHIFAYGALPLGRSRRGQIEAYQQGRFFTVTGRPLIEMPATVEQRHVELVAFHARHLAEPTSSSATATPASLGDDVILEQCRTAKNAIKFRDLWAGQWQGYYTSQSEADLGLLGLLRFYSQDDQQLDRLFRRSGLIRPKWDQQHGETTYGQRTIAQALKLTMASYGGDLYVDRPGPAPASITRPWVNSLLLVRTAPPEAVWLLEGILPQGSVVMLSGREGDMKSWLTMDMCTCVAAGRPWIGRETEAAAVCYVDAEMPGHLLRGRVYAAGPSENLNVLTWQADGFPWTLDHPAMLLAAQEHRLVVIDTLRRFMEDGDENSANDMAVITAKIRRLTTWGATVLILHHGIKDRERGGYRGSTELGAAVDISLHVEKVVENGETRLILDAPKTRFSADPKLIIKVDKTDARPVFSDITGTVKAAKQLAKESDFLAIGTLLQTLADRDGQDPSQSDLVEAAGAAGCGSRNTILGKLRDGEGRYWESYLTGRSKAYRRITTCPVLPLQGVLDRLDRSGQPIYPVQHGIGRTGGQVVTDPSTAPTPDQTVPEVILDDL